MEFHAAAWPADALCAELATRFPANPFLTPQFVAARAASGAQPWVIALRDGARIVAGCTAFMTSGLLTRALEIQSVAGVPSREFWDGVIKLCRERRTTTLLVGSFGSEAFAIPHFDTETSRRSRREYVLHLSNGKVSGALSTNHKRNIARAKKLGLVMRASANLEACSRHAELMTASMSRRAARGEAVSNTTDVDNIWSYVSSGSGTLYQTFEGSAILSSVLVFTAKRGAYYYSAGTSSEGMAKGASHFLIQSIAESLAQQDLELFNLGGADDGNLGRFKAGFGAEAVELEAASFYVGSPARRQLISVARTLRQHPSTLLHSFGQIDSYIAFAGRPQDLAPPDPAIEARLEKLTDDALNAAIRNHPEMALYARVLQQLGHNDAYGLYHLGELVHVSWLIPEEHARRYPIRNVKLRRGEAEITHAVTLSKFRGKGFFAHAIRALAALGATHGVRRVFAIAASDNIASQQAIQKAGLRKVGRIWRVNLRYPRGASVTLRGHRYVCGVLRWREHSTEPDCYRSQ